MTNTQGKYKFVCCNLAPSVIRRPHWYLVLEPGDIELLELLHHHVSMNFVQKFGNPHMAGDPDTGFFYQPIMLASKWLQTVEYMLQDGPILVNPRGGLTQFEIERPSGDKK